MVLWLLSSQPFIDIQLLDDNPLSYLLIFTYPSGHKHNCFFLLRKKKKIFFCFAQLNCVQIFEFQNGHFFHLISFCGALHLWFSVFIRFSCSTSIGLDFWWKSFYVESLIDSCWSKRSLCSPSFFILDLPIQHFSSPDNKCKVNYHWLTINVG